MNMEEYLLEFSSTFKHSTCSAIVAVLQTYLYDFSGYTPELFSLVLKNTPSVCTSICCYSCMRTI